ncbi:hypothetical protein A4D02_21745 [Niastella koreensis]|uniref:Uncharacterized protein n=2 Tax=Niastella koreensis TaxID=354356 RepID=G8THT4_NIAKG|nr:hypothetical protein [Niastella koreensis]AEV98529.1 hypothetical protein Niako_2174 [Niastella koreensis GR20-10]OQP53028.1 hypothetical protein A4D02_21745 [Niastella koreensis]
MTNRFLIMALCLCLSVSAFAYRDPNKAPHKDWSTVLTRNKVGKKYVFDRSKKGQYNQTELTYLGKIKTNDGRIFKVVTSTVFFGNSPAATNKVVVFNSKNQYVGNYAFGADFNLPKKIVNNELVFDHKDTGGLCDPSVVNRISFEDGLPKQMFVECRNKQGDLYSFSD